MQRAVDTLGECHAVQNLEQWFLTGGVNKFLVGGEPLRALQQGKFAH